MAIYVVRRCGIGQSRTGSIASSLWKGEASGSPKGAGHWKNVVAHILKYAVFDTKPT